MICSAGSPRAVQTNSEIKGASLVPLQSLPRSPETGTLDGYCDGYREKKLSATGRLVEKLGWIVTSEAPLGRYHVVTFASGFDPGTSALCFARNANIAIFDGSNLVALAYGKSGRAGPLGVVEPLEGGGLLIWTDPPGFPVGELHADTDRLQLTPVAPARSLCNGRATVPNIYGKKIEVARDVLISHGWQPQRPKDRPGDWNSASQLSREGVIEAENCSGTGVGYCSFKYRTSAGVLGVTTAGEDHQVVNYGVSCKFK